MDIILSISLPFLIILCAYGVHRAELKRIEKAKTDFTKQSTEFQSLSTSHKKIYKMWERHNPLRWFTDDVTRLAKLKVFIEDYLRTEAACIHQEIVSEAKASYAYSRVEVIELPNVTNVRFV